MCLQGNFGLGHELSGVELSKQEHERLSRARDLGILIDERRHAYPGFHASGTLHGDSPKVVHDVLLQSQAETLARNGWSSDAHELHEKAFDRFAMPYNLHDRGYPNWLLNRAELTAHLAKEEAVSKANLRIGSAFEGYKSGAFENSPFSADHVPYMAHAELPTHLLRASAGYNHAEERNRQWNLQGSSPTARYIRERADIETRFDPKIEGGEHPVFEGKGTSTGHSTGLSVAMEGEIAALQAHPSTFYGATVRA